MATGNPDVRAVIIRLFYRKRIKNTEALISGK